MAIRYCISGFYSMPRGNKNVVQPLRCFAGMYVVNILGSVDLANNTVQFAEALQVGSLRFDAISFQFLYTSVHIILNFGQLNSFAGSLVILLNLVILLSF